MCSNLYFFEKNIFSNVTILNKNKKIIFNYFCYKYGYFNLYYTVVACGSLNPKDIAKNFTKDFYSSDAKSVMSYIDLSEKKKHLLMVKSLKFLLKMQLKQKEWAVLKIFKMIIIKAPIFLLLKKTENDLFYLNKILYFFLILFLLIGIWVSLLDSNPSNQIIKKPHLPSLEIGYLVFRVGIGSESFLIENLSKSPYSHIAMVVKPLQIILIHATTDDDKNAFLLTIF